MAVPLPRSGSAKNSEHCPFVVEGLDVTIPVPGKQPRGQLAPINRLRIVIQMSFLLP